MASPELHLHQLDVVQQAGLFVQMTPRAYREASFLDGRSFDAGTLAGWVPLQIIKDTVLHGPASGSPLHFIFHMGHTGSTLLSRLIDESGKVLPLREPLVLRELASLHDAREDPASLVSPRDIDGLTEIMLRLWSRCGEAQQCAVLKATSSTSRIAPDLMSARPASRAVYLSMAPEPYLAVILGGPASLMDVRGHAVERMRRFVRLIGSAPSPLHSLSPGELAAMSWVTEALSHQRLADAAGERLLQVDFDDFLANVQDSIGSVLAHFGLAGGSELAGRIARSPVLGRYAKAPEHAYSSGLRDEVIQSSRQQNSTEIARGMTLLSELAGEHEAVSGLLDSAG